MLLAELVRRPDRALGSTTISRSSTRPPATASARSRPGSGASQSPAPATSPHPDDRLLYIDLIHHLLARELIDDELERRWSRRRAACSTATPTLELAAARLAFATGRPRDALEPLEWLVGLDDDEIIATGASYDERVFGEWSWGLIGLCRLRAGRRRRRGRRVPPRRAAMRPATRPTWCAAGWPRRAWRRARLGLTAYYPAVMPRSTERIAPWMLRPSSDATNANIAAMSSDEPIERNPV